MPTGIEEAIILSQMLGNLGGIFGQEDTPSSQLVSRDAFNQALSGTRGALSQAGGRTRELYGMNLSAIQNALGGGLGGLSGDVRNQMFAQSRNQLAPQFSQQRDALRASFNPRLAGSGAAASQLQQLLGGQAQTLGGINRGINIQDAQSRTQGQFAGFGALNQLFGQQQSSQDSLRRLLGSLSTTQVSG